MIAFLAPLLLGWGVPARLAKPLAWAVSALACLAIAVLIAWTLIAHGKALGKAECERAQAAAVHKADVRNDAAKDAAAVERVNDTATITNAQEERANAIDHASPSSTGAASRALGCVRWAQQHLGSAKPAGC